MAELLNYIIKIKGSIFPPLTQAPIGNNQPIQGNLTYEILANFKGYGGDATNGQITGYYNAVTTSSGTIILSFSKAFFTFTQHEIQPPSITGTYIITPDGKVTLNFGTDPDDFPTKTFGPAPFNYQYDFIQPGKAALFVDVQIGAIPVKQSATPANPTPVPPAAGIPQPAPTPTKPVTPPGTTTPPASPITPTPTPAPTPPITTGYTQADVDRLVAEARARARAEALAEAQKTTEQRVQEEAARAAAANAASKSSINRISQLFSKAARAYSIFRRTPNQSNGSAVLAFVTQIRDAINNSGSTISQEVSTNFNEQATEYEELVNERLAEIARAVAPPASGTSVTPPPSVPNQSKPAPSPVTTPPASKPQPGKALLDQLAAAKRSVATIESIINGEKSRLAAAQRATPINTKTVATLMRSIADQTRNLNNAKQLLDRLQKQVDSFK